VKYHKKILIGFKYMKIKTIGGELQVRFNGFFYLFSSLDLEKNKAFSFLCTQPTFLNEGKILKNYINIWQRI
jgi:hypothetical protein